MALPRKNSLPPVRVLKRPRHVSSAPSGPEYERFLALVMERADVVWRNFCGPVGETRLLHYVLVEEYFAPGRTTGGAPPQRTWIRDEAGLRAISLAEHTGHKRKINSSIYPFVIVRFHINVEAQRVEFGMVTGSRSGRGCTYMIGRSSGKENNGGQANEGGEECLVPAPDGMMWIS
jgi:hypothetical protein